MQQTEALCKITEWHTYAICTEHDCRHGGTKKLLRNVSKYIRTYRTMQGRSTVSNYYATI